MQGFLCFEYFLDTFVIPRIAGLEFYVYSFKIIVGIFLKSDIPLAQTTRDWKKGGEQIEQNYNVKTREILFNRRYSPLRGLSF